MPCEHFTRLAPSVGRKEPLVPEKGEPILLGLKPLVIFLFELAYFSHLDPSFDFNGLPFSDEDAN